MVENLAEMRAVVLWKAELAWNELVYLAEEISKQSIKGVTWFLFYAHSKLR